MSNGQKYFTNKGFTLIEMMVVVAIVAILAAIGIPQYKKYMLNAKIVEAKTAAKSIADAMRTYYDTHGKFPDDMYTTVVYEDYTVFDGHWGGQGYRGISADLPTLDISSSTNFQYGVNVSQDAVPGVFVVYMVPVGFSSDVHGKYIFYLSDLDACGVTSANKAMFDGNFYTATIFTPGDTISDAAEYVRVDYLLYDIAPNCFKR